MGIEAIDEQFAEMVEPRVIWIGSFAEQTEAAQWASAASVCHTEEERSAVIDASKNVKYEVVREGTVFRIIRTETEESLAAKLIKEGKPIPYTKGPGGYVQEIDGSVSPARSKVAGIPLPWYAWNAVPVEEDVNKILETTLPSMFESSASAGAEEFGSNILRPLFQGQISQLGSAS